MFDEACHPLTSDVPVLMHGKGGIGEREAMTPPIQASDL